ncbi:MAG: hypothetical protein ACC707_17160 [Thiohalomonadales bacterium]
MDSWIAALPQADPSQSGRLLYDYLTEINALNIAKKERYYILQTLRKRIENITQTFKRYFIVDNIPLSPKNQALFELTIGLNLQMALGYKILIDQTWSQKLTLLNKKPTVALLYWAIHYLSEILLVSYQIYTEHPENTWIDLHQFYLYAEENGLSTTKILDHRHKEGPSENTILSRYKQILLMGLISPYRLRQQTIEKVYVSLETWNEYCHVKSVDDFSRHKHEILIRLNSDLTPGFYLSDKAYNRTYTRVLDTKALESLLSESLTQTVNSGFSSADTEIPPAVVEILLSTWSGNTKRTSSRISTDSKLQVSIGIKATHFFISTANREHHELQDQNSKQPEKTPHKKETAFKLADTVEISDIYHEPHKPQLELSLQEWDNNEAHHFDRTVVVASDAPDIWDPTYTNNSIGYDDNIRDWLDHKKSETKTTPPKQSHYDNANESASGYCLITRMSLRTKMDNLQIGDIIGIRKFSGDLNTPVGIGIIRRIKNADNKIDLGIQKLVPIARAIELSQFHPLATRRKFNRALLLPAIKPINRPVTLLCTNSYKIDDTLIVNQDGQQSLVKVTLCLEATGVVNQYGFLVVKNLGFKKLTTKTEDTRHKKELTWS